MEDDKDCKIWQILTNMADESLNAKCQATV